MSWLELHRRSEDITARAELAAREGARARSHELFIQAAEAEKSALLELDSTKLRTLGISVVSAVSLYYKGLDYDSSDRLAMEWLANERLPAFATEQLRILLQSIWSERVRKDSGVMFAPGQVVVSIKGGDVVEGGAPLDLIIGKVQAIQALFYRTSEWMQGLPYRRRGPPPKDIQESCRPWLFQTAPGSYQFAVAIQQAPQVDFLKHDEPLPEEVADHFLRILKASVEDPEEGLAEVVSDSDYRGTFLKLTRNLAPTGKIFEELEIRSADERVAVNLIPQNRNRINTAIRRTRESALSTADREETLKGTLRAVHLDQDWLEVTIDSNHIRVHEVGEQVDDVIGPMVNKPVIVTILVDATDRRKFLDIEPDD